MSPPAYVRRELIWDLRLFDALITGFHDQAVALDKGDATPPPSSGYRRVGEIAVNPYNSDQFRLIFTQ
jgi:hypothetical protein